MRFGWLSLLLLLGALIESVQSSMCKILYRAYYDFKSLDFNNFPQYDIDFNHKVYYRLCTNYNDSLTKDCGDDNSSKGNVVLVDNSGPKSTCTSLASIEKAPEKTIWKVEYWQRLTEYYTDGKHSLGLEQLEGRLLNNTSGTAISYKINTTDPYVNSKGIKSFAFGLICNKSLSPDQSVKKNKLVNSTLWFFFEGIQACGFTMIEPSVFMKNHIMFPVMFIFLSFCGMLLRRISERLMMSCFGFQFGIFLTVMFMANLELHFHFDSTTLVCLLICCLLMACFFGFICFASRNISIFILFIGAAISLSFTFLTVLALVTSDGVSPQVFALVVVSLVIIMALLNNVPSFYDDYAHMYLVSIDFPFYFVMSLAVIVGWYPDLLTIRKAHEFGITLTPRKEYWWFVGIQLILTLALFVDSKFIANSHRDLEQDEDQKRKTLLNDSESNDHIRSM